MKQSWGSTKGYQLILKNAFMNEASIFFIFHYFPHMQPVTFHVLFLLISIIFINKCAKMPFNDLSFAFSNFLSHKQPNEHPLGCLAQHSTWNKCPIHQWLLFLTFITWNFHQGCYTIIVCITCTQYHLHNVCTKSHVHGATCTTCTQHHITLHHLYNVCRMPHVHSTTCTTCVRYHMYIAPHAWHVRNTTCRQCHLYNMYTTPHAHNTTCKIMHTTPYVQHACNTPCT